MLFISVSSEADEEGVRQYHDSVAASLKVFPLFSSFRSPFLLDTSFCSPGISFPSLAMICFFTCWFPCMGHT